MLPLVCGVCHAAKRPKLAFEQADDEPAAGEAAAAGGGDSQQRQPHQRHFRGQRVETPSHPGGVSTPARETLEASKQRQKERERSGLFASTSNRSGSERDRSDRPDGAAERGSRGDRDRGDHRSSRHDSGSRDRDHERSSRDRDSRDRPRDYDRDRGRDSRDERDRGEYERGGRSERGERDHRGGSRDHRDGGGGSSSRRQTDGSSRWDTATPLRQADDADGGWGSTPARPGSSHPSSTPLRDGRDPRSLAAPSPWETVDGSSDGGSGRAGAAGGSTPRLPPRSGGSSTGTRGGWGSSTAGSSDLPAVARPGGATPARGAGGAATGASGIVSSIGRVKFEVEASPALTPSWKSTSWSRPKRPGANAGGEAGDESPKLAEEAPAGEFDEALK